MPDDTLKYRQGHRAEECSFTRCKECNLGICLDLNLREKKTEVENEKRPEYIYYMHYLIILEANGQQSTHEIYFDSNLCKNFSHEL